ncbi:single-stranded DNA-binding protein [Micromonospora sp. KC723]|uniref:single-stranded DNA-binding protein n=1 Tax=Micromonospora sp. KC723 TaxID=2530381 RepID=UPI001049968C|nr:single-stranded DNA-binding protein [Micromonospora sp. KC723]TDB76322.1 single-stranded DNA-binding protein [Micromonospora sp. KC723]
MFDTYVTIVGNVLTAPEWRRTTQSNTLVANFKVASTARRLDRDSGRWVDGNSLRVRVNCWRRLAEGVAASVMVGDPVVVAGRLYTRDWTDEAGNHRTLYELEAVAVGHDLSRGRARFLRNRPTTATSVVEDAETAARVHGEPAEPVPHGQAPNLPDDRPFEEGPEFSGFTAPQSGYESTGYESTGRADESGVGEPPGGHGPFAGGTADLPRRLPGAAGPDLSAAGPGKPAGATDDRPTDDELAPEPGGGDDDEADGGAGELDPAPDETSVTPPGRGRRGRGRVPVPA